MVLSPLNRQLPRPRHLLESEKEGTENMFVKPADSNIRKLSNDEISKTKPFQRSFQQVNEVILVGNYLMSVIDPFLISYRSRWPFLVC